MSEALVDELVVVGKRNDAEGASSVGFIRVTWQPTSSSNDGRAYYQATNNNTTPHGVAVNRIREHLAGDPPTMTTQDLKDMVDYNIFLNEVLKPGIHQMEFNVVISGVETFTEHRQWVKVNASGVSELITATFSGDGKIDVRVEAWESSDHGRAHTQTDIRAFVVSSTVGNPAETNARWSAMVTEANLLDSQGWNYNGFVQNSNSVFYTVGLAGGVVSQNSDGIAPGIGRNLDKLTPENQAPSLGPGSSHSLNGTDAADAVYGDGSPAIIQGFGGNDDLRGGNASDMVFGGAGADNISLIGGAARGGSEGDVMSASSTASVQMAGDEGDDSLTGGSSMDALSGGIGEDWVHGKMGDDIIDLGTGNDTGYGGQGDDQIQGGDGNDLILGDLGNDILFGEGGRDDLRGGDGNDVLIGGGGNDTMNGGAGADFVRGGDGADEVWGGDGADIFAYGTKGVDWWGWVDSGYMYVGPEGAVAHAFDTIHDFASGTDRIDLASFGITYSDLTFGPLAQGDVGIYFSYQAPGREHPELLVRLLNVTNLQPGDFIFSSAALPPPNGVALYGNDAGPSSLVGGAGNDTLSAAHQADVLTGNGGADAFVFTQFPWNAGHVTDFNPGVDHLDLRSLFAASGYYGSNPIADGRLEFRSDGAGSTQVYVDKDSAGSGEWPITITTLDGVSPSQIGSGDWLFQ
jgi:Ca2+-binding RTX toxin-like protein